MESQAQISHHPQNDVRLDSRPIACRVYDLITAPHSETNRWVNDARLRVPEAYEAAVKALVRVGVGKARDVVGAASVDLWGYCGRREEIWDYRESKAWEVVGSSVRRGRRVLVLGGFSAVSTGRRGRR